MASILAHPTPAPGARGAGQASPEACRQASPEACRQAWPEACRRGARRQLEVLSVEARRADAHDDDGHVVTVAGAAVVE
ncbi:MAG TPA: hypothetical protein VMD59_13575, partial [Acidimicrobiales bacterium]|nr:hypothetical protein [Acidimicrobiales bacterium]